MDFERIGKYKIVGKIGQGAMGEVYKAHDPVLNRDVAIKTISAAVGTDEDLRKRFHREAQSAARLNHPNIITVYDFGEEHGVAYMAMELLEGSDLRSVIGNLAVTLDEKLSVMEQICDGLAFAHAKEIVHRDLKPANIHVQPNGQVKIMDFGLARLGVSDMTRTGMVMGTPNYMSPEQVRGEKVDVRSDIFSIGAVFYELLTVHKPFDADSMHAVLFQVLENDPEPPRRWVPTLPPVLVQLVERALRKEPARRFPNGGEILEAVREARQAIPAEILATALPLMDPTGETIASDGIPRSDVPQTGVTAAKKSRWTSIRGRPSAAASDPGSRAIPRPALSKTLMGGAPTRMEVAHARQVSRPAPPAATAVPGPMGPVGIGGRRGSPGLVPHPSDGPVSPRRGRRRVSTSCGTGRTEPHPPAPAGGAGTEPNGRSCSVSDGSAFREAEIRRFAPPPSPQRRQRFRRWPRPEPPRTAPTTTEAPAPTPVPVTAPSHDGAPSPRPRLRPRPRPPWRLSTTNRPSGRWWRTTAGPSRRRTWQLFKSVKPDLTADEEKRLRDAFQGGVSQTVRITILTSRSRGRRRRSASRGRTRSTAVPDLPSRRCASPRVPAAGHPRNRALGRPACLRSCTRSRRSGVTLSRSPASFSLKRRLKSTQHAPAGVDLEPRPRRC